MNAETNDPIHETSSPQTSWSRVNAAEAFQGVLTPLNYSVLAEPIELGSRQAFQDMGIFSAEEVQFFDSPDDRLGAIFFGRWASNMSLTATIGDRVPGTSAAAFQRDLFGQAGGSLVRDPLMPLLRYASIAAKLPTAVAMVPRRLRRLRGETDAWWRKTVALDPKTLSTDAALVILDEARGRLQANTRAHIIGSMLAQVTFERLSAIAMAADFPGLEIDLTTGYGSMEEGRSLEDLWEVSQGQRELSEFIQHHGYHGPLEGELSSIVWREDPSVLSH